MISADLSIAASVAELVGQPVTLIRMLAGGTHAETALIAVRGRELVARRFPQGDGAVAHELPVLERLGSLGALVPELVAYRDGLNPLIVTTKVTGSPPDPSLDLNVIAAAMANVLAQVHTVGGDGLERVRNALPRAETSIAQSARRNPPSSDPSRDVLVHGDFWCGNALWSGSQLTGLVDWSGGRAGSRGVDISWCRQDLVLLGSTEAADIFLLTYEQVSGIKVADLREWDLVAGAWADTTVETWAPNYTGIGRDEITPELLRARLDDWNHGLMFIK